MLGSGGRLLESELLRGWSRGWSGAGGRRTDGGIEVVDGEKRDVPIFGVDMAGSALVEGDPEGDVKHG